MGKLYWDPDRKEQELGCAPLDFTIKSTSSLEAPTVMVDRGNCTFVTKTRHVEEIGGEVALIVNNDDTDPREIFMESDNSQKVIIPSVLIGKEDAQIIKDFWLQSLKYQIEPEITIAIKFEMKQTKGSEPEKMDLYFTSIDEQIYKFLTTFRKYYWELSKN